jgi:hypothetical protein
MEHLVLDTEDLADKSNADAFAKAIAVLQFSWFICQMLTRKAKHILVSQLEIVTLAFGVLAVCIYGAYWSKPQNVENPTYVHMEVFSEDPERDQQIRRSLQPDKSTSIFRRALWHSDFFKEKNGATRVPNDNFNFNLLPACLMCLVIVTVFGGGLHCVAWNFAFPSYVELTMWHVASITTTVIQTFDLRVAVCCHYVAKGDLQAWVREQQSGKSSFSHSVDHLGVHRLFSLPSQPYGTYCDSLEEYARRCLCEYLGAISSSPSVMLQQHERLDPRTLFYRHVLSRKEKRERRLEIDC